MTRERAGVSDAADDDGRTMATLMSALAAAVAGGAWTAVVRPRRPPRYLHRCRVCHWRACRHQPVRAGRNGRLAGVLQVNAVLVALLLPPAADGAASHPPPQPPTSTPVFAAPAAVTAALRVATRVSGDTKVAVDAPPPADGGERSWLDVVRGTPAAAAVAVAAADGAAASARLAALATTAIVLSLLTDGDASTAVAGVFFRARCLPYKKRGRDIPSFLTLNPEVPGIAVEIDRLRGLITGFTRHVTRDFRVTRAVRNLLIRRSGRRQSRVHICKWSGRIDTGLPAALPPTVR